jgi:hypothetical protein
VNGKPMDFEDLILEDLKILFLNPKKAELGYEIKKTISNFEMVIGANRPSYIKVLI